MASGKGLVIVIKGGPGSGKSTMAREIQSWCEILGLEVRNLDAGSSKPLAPDVLNRRLAQLRGPVTIETRAPARRKRA